MRRTGGSDEKLRELQRAFHESGSAEAELAWLRESARTAVALEWDELKRLHQLDPHTAAECLRAATEAGALSAGSRLTLETCLQRSAETWPLTGAALFQVGRQLGLRALCQLVSISIREWPAAFSGEAKDLCVAIDSGLAAAAALAPSGAADPALLEALALLEAREPGEVLGVVLGVRYIYWAIVGRSLGAWNAAQQAAERGASGQEVAANVLNTYADLFGDDDAHRLLEGLLDAFSPADTGPTAAAKTRLWATANLCARALDTLASEGVPILVPWPEFARSLLASRDPPERGGER